jgi:hypothetical protein
MHRGATRGDGPLAAEPGVVSQTVTKHFGGRSMKLTNSLPIAFLIAIWSAANCQAQIIVATETENAAYADGIYESSPPEYVSHFVLLEDQKKLVRTQLV